MDDSVKSRGGPAERSEQDIFHEALARTDPAAREAFLDGACGPDAALRARVEALLRNHATTGSFMAAPAIEPATLVVSSSPVAGASFIATSSLTVS